MAALSDIDPSFEGEGGNNHVTSEVKAVCAIYPPAQIRKYEDTDAIFDAYKALMGDGASQDDFDKASPVLQITKQFPPTMLIHGSTDSVVKLSDSTDLYAKLTDLNIPTELHIFSEEEHAFDSQRGYGRSVAELQNLFFKKYL
jgi:dipeptidyl aminopeptidase/acylaminoacyl peptidase